MANYLKGIGDSVARVNEILPSMDARIYNFLGGHASGIIRGEFNDFNASAIDRGVRIRSGMMQVHGYYGLCDTDTQINFVMPASQQFSQIFAEIDLTVVPNRFRILSTTPSNSQVWTPRQDNLRTNTSGRFQFPLWQARLNTNGTITLTDRRVFVDRPHRAMEALNVTPGGTIASELAAVRAEMATLQTALNNALAQRMMRLQLVTSTRQFDVTAANVGSLTVTVNSGVTINDGDLLIVNARVGAIPFSGIARLSGTNNSRIGYTAGGHGMPWNALNAYCVWVRRSSATQLIFQGNPRTQITSGNTNQTHTHATTYHIDNVFKIHI